MHSPTARVFLRFPKFLRHLACKDHAILHGKPFGIPLFCHIGGFQPIPRDCNDKGHNVCADGPIDNVLFSSTIKVAQRE